jgi:hypothetical protein
MKKKKVIELLEYWLQTKAAIFKGYETYLLDSEPVQGKLGVEDNPGRRIFIDRGSDVLFVAHIDTVQTPRFRKQKENKIWAAGLDDRLGCALADHYAREWNVDLLICDYEESAMSSGSHHDLKEYNWIAEFDRNGGDVVTYDMENDDWLNCLHKYFDIGWGTFSDLCSLKTKCCALNIGIGYKHDHSEDSYVDLCIMNNQIKKFKEFFDVYKDTKFVQDEEKYRNNIYTGWYGNNYTRDSWSDAEYRECDYCGNLGAEEVHGARICQDCFETMTSSFLYADFEEGHYRR